MMNQQINMDKIIHFVIVKARNSLSHQQRSTRPLKYMVVIWIFVLFKYKIQLRLCPWNLTTISKKEAGNDWLEKVVRDSLPASSTAGIVCPSQGTLKSSYYGSIGHKLIAPFSISSDCVRHNTQCLCHTTIYGSPDQLMGLNASIDFLRCNSLIIKQI